MNAPWVNAILHTSAQIQKKKVALATAHSWKSIWLVIFIIALELYLACISIPLYLVASTQKDAKSAPSGQHYRVRRVITLSLLTSLGIIWLIKLLLAGGFIYYWSKIPQLQTQDTTVQTNLSHDQLLTINQATVEPDEPLVVITNASQLGNGTVVITGKAIPKSNILIYLTRSDSPTAHDSNNKLTLVTTDADTIGTWQVRLSEYRFNFLPGTYTIQAIWYDAQDTMKSPLSETKTFNITHQALTPENLIHQADQWLNILLLIFVVGSIVLTIILT